MKSVMQRRRFPLEVILVGVRWYVAYPLSLRSTNGGWQGRSSLRGTGPG
jgi:transposase-like protein